VGGGGWANAARSDGTDWKPFHHDSHAYGAGGKKEDFTVGASFGGERSLAFQHPSGHEFTIPQRNGDIFAFTSKVNKCFKHGVPKVGMASRLCSPPSNSSP